MGGSQQVQDDDIIVSGAELIGGTFDQFHYMYRQVSGDADIVARIKAVQYIAAGSRGGVTARDSLGGNGTHVSMLLRAGQRHHSAEQNRSRRLDDLCRRRAQPYWVKLEVRGQVVTAFQSPDGASWSTVGGAPLSLPSPYYIGVAVASQDAQTLANAAFDQLRLVEVGHNQPPTIALTGPDTSVSYTAPANVTISADASDADGTISSVDFYQNGTLLGSVSTPPCGHMAVGSIRHVHVFGRGARQRRCDVHVRHANDNCQGRIECAAGHHAHRAGDGVSIRGAGDHQCECDRE